MNPPRYRLPLRTQLGLSVYRLMRDAQQHLPLSPGSKARLAGWLFRLTGPLLRDTPAYRAWQMRQPVAQLPPPITREPGDTALDVARIRLPTSGQPRVSVIIPVFNKLAYTLNCLASIARNAPRAAFEVLVVDDCSSDGSAEALARVHGVRVLRNERNQGFLRSCNLAASESRGEFLLFLNNDTEVLPGWLDELLAVVEQTPSAGLVGSMLLYPDGRLQEAGGAVWRDGSGMNCGRGEHPQQPEFNYVREVNYCSGASILIARSQFIELGSFDERFAPAYYEDTDLAFKVRAAGSRVLYTPFSKVVHFEGVSSGTDPRQGIKAFQRANQSVFRDKWSAELASHPLPGTPVHQRAAGTGKRALVIDAVTPQPDKDSGSVDTLHQLALLRDLGYAVTFLPDSLNHHGPYTEALQRLGIRCLYGPFVESPRAHLQQEGAQYDLVVLKRAHYASKHIDDVRRYCRDARVVFETVDLHYLRELRQAEHEGSEAKRLAALRTRELEWSVMRRADATIVISDEEARLLASEQPDIRVHAIPFIRDVRGSRAPWHAREHALFVGSFLHEPNLDAVRWLCSEIWPIVHAQLPEARLRIIGSHMPDSLKQLGQLPGVQVDGFVADLEAAFDRARVSIAPLRFGAGIKGKVGSALSNGLPCVVTTIAAEGMQLRHRQSAMIADSAAAFAEAVVAVYRDAELWQSLSDAGLHLMRGHYSAERGRERWQSLLEMLRQHR